MDVPYAIINGKVTVKAAVANVPMTVISGKEATLLEVGKKDTLAVTFALANTTDSKTVVWTTSDASVATDISGNK